MPGPLDGVPVLEVGPGPGGLTRALLRAGAAVTAIERDDRCLPALAELAAAFPGRLTVIPDDALAVDTDAILPPGHRIVANLPYNIGTLLWTRWLEPAVWPPRWASLTCMFQDEVARRIVAPVGDGAYGRLAVLSQWRCAPRLAMKVHRSAFTPPPKVMSAMVHLEPVAQPPGVDPALLSRLTAAGFGQRRKMLRQSLRGVPGALDALDVVGIDPTRRAETVAVADWVALARVLGARQDRQRGEGRG